ncbi:MAG TPA: hypothetical protein VEI82_06415 [Myxococcota bacterium]|nr:hypothetical protein [Myxococcota bacterium]
MSYIAPKDYAADPEIVAKILRTVSGQLELDWMKRVGEPAAFRPSQPTRGLTLDDINQGGYAPDKLPDVIRHNFSMAPRGALLPPGLPSLGYRVNRKSDVWADVAASLFEEAKSRRWAPARDVPWTALDPLPHGEQHELALRQLATGLISTGLVCCDLAASWEWRMNQEFHEIKYLLCAQMFDAARIAEAFRKRALFGGGSLGVDSRALGELLKSVFLSDTYPEASAAMNLLVFSWVQAVGRHWAATATNAADLYLGTQLAQDATRFLAYGIDHVRSHLHARALSAEALADHLDLCENALVGTLGAPEIIEPMVLLSGGFEPVAGFYARTANEYFRRCDAAGLGDRRDASALTSFLRMLQGDSR